MVELISETPEVKKKKQYQITLPNVTGKFGFSICIGKKELFIGIAVADIEVETVVKRKKKKVFIQKGKGMFIPT